MATLAEIGTENIDRVLADLERELRVKTEVCQAAADLCKEADGFLLPPEVKARLELLIDHLNTAADQLKIPFYRVEKS